MSETARNPDGTTVTTGNNPIVPVRRDGDGEERGNNPVPPQPRPKPDNK